MSPWKSLATIRKSLWSREQRIFSIRGFGLSLKWKRLEKVSDIRRKVYLIYLARERLMTTNIILYCLREKNFILCVLVFHLIKWPNVEFEQTSEFYNEVNAIFRNLLDHLLSHLQSISSFSMSCQFQFYRKRFNSGKILFSVIRNFITTLWLLKLF